MLRAVYAHAGGSPEGLRLAGSASEIADLDALKKGSDKYFWRKSGRAAPHNLYTSTANLLKFIGDRKAATFDSLAEQGFLFKSDAPAAKPGAQRLQYYFIYKEQTAGWLYDSKTNGYYRLRLGRADVDALTNTQVWFKNVAVIEVKEAPIPGDAKGRIEQQVVGEGAARIFLDGEVREATWRKASGAGALRFFDSTGSEIRFNAGPIWIAAIPKMNNLTVR